MHKIFIYQKQIEMYIYNLCVCVLCVSIYWLFRKNVSKISEFNQL